MTLLCQLWTLNEQIEELKKKSASAAAAAVARKNRKEIEEEEELEEEEEELEEAEEDRGDDHERGEGSALNPNSQSAVSAGLLHSKEGRNRVSGREELDWEDEEFEDEEERIRRVRHSLESEPGDATADIRSGAEVGIEQGQ